MARPLVSAAGELDRPARTTAARDGVDGLLSRYLKSPAFNARERHVQPGADGGALPYDAIVGDWVQLPEAMQGAFAGPEGQAAGAGRRGHGCGAGDGQG
jgi:hypothetical protein